MASKVSEHDYEASRVDIEADEISKPRLIRKSNVHHGSSVVAKGDAKVTIRSQYPSSGKGPKRSPAGSVIESDSIYVEAREIDPKGRTKDGSREQAVAKRGVWFTKLRRNE